MKTIRLNADQKEHLQDLAIAPARPQKETAALVAKGLAYVGRGRPWGVFVALTLAGRALAGVAEKVVGPSPGPLLAQPQRRPPPKRKTNGSRH